MDRHAEERFGRFFDHLLEQHGISGAEAARRLHVAQSQVSRWRRGEGGLSMDSLHRIHDVFGTDLDYLKELTGYYDYAPSVYRTDDIDPDISARLDAIRTLLRDQLRDIPVQFWTSYLEASGVVIKEIARTLQTPSPEEQAAAPEPRRTSRARRPGGGSNGGSGAGRGTVTAA